MTCSSAQEPVESRSGAPSNAPDSALDVTIEGAGPDVLLIHGLSANRGKWNRLAPLLQGRFRLVRPDLAGRGVSPAPPEIRFGLADEASRLLGLLDSLAVERPILVGHSQGAALAVAVQASGRGRALLLLNPVTPWTRRPAALDLLRRRPVRKLLGPVARHYRMPLTRYILTRRVYANPELATEAAVRTYSEALESVERVDTLLRVLADWRPSELASHRGQLAVPAMVVAGGLDRRISPADARRWAARLGAGYTVLADCAHGIPEEAPERVAGMIRELDRAASE